MKKDINNLNHSDKLIRIVSEWLLGEGISDKVKSYSQSGWNSICTNFYQDSIAVLYIGKENLYDLLNNTSQFIIFDDLIRSLGFYFQLGKPGHIGFNRIFNFQYKDSLLPHHLLYTHKKWNLKKSLLLNQARYRCQYCQRFDKLNVYQSNYHEDNAPWEYPLNYYKVLCGECLDLHTRIETVFRAFLPTIPHDKLKNILDRIHPDFDWYHPNNIEDYVSTIWPLIPHSVNR